MKKTLTLIIALLTFSSCGEDEQQLYTLKCSFIVHIKSSSKTECDCERVFLHEELLRETPSWDFYTERAVELYWQYKNMPKNKYKRICVEYGATRRVIDLGNGEFYFPELHRKGDFACFYKQTWKRMWWDDEPDI